MGRSARAFVIECEEEQLPVLREQVGSWLHQQHVEAQLAFEVKLVAHEAAKNAISHSIGATTSPDAEIDRDEIAVRVGDTNAHHWEPQAVTTTTTEVHSRELIRALTRKMNVAHNDDGTALIMVLERDSPQR